MCGDLAAVTGAAAWVTCAQPRLAGLSCSEGLEGLDV